MASRSKQKTTMAKLNRERAVQERRVQKQVRKDARRQAAAERPLEATDAQDAAPLDERD
jgi:hypothetical protein